MIFIIGGASRSGKTMLAKKVAASLGAGWFSTDFLKQPIEVAAPHLNVQGARDGVVNGKDFMLFAQRQWPFVSELIKSIHASKTDYVIEGEILTPQLINTLDIKIAPCFLGYHTANAATKLAEINTHKSTNDWTRAYNAKEQLCIVEERIKFSAQIAAQASACNMPYFDLSRDFDKGIEGAYETLIRSRRSL